MLRSDDGKPAARGQKRIPDHGSLFVPSAGPEDLAPKSLDHFKRGYQERAEHREKELYGSHNNRAAPEGRLPRDRVSRGERTTILNGFNVLEFINQVSEFQNDRRRIFDALNTARKNYPEPFENGKGLTALISSAARRRHVKLAHIIWDWMDEARVEKNTFHYNSMISATEKSKNYREALALMREMERRNIPKNEVT